MSTVLAEAPVTVAPRVARVLIVQWHDSDSDVDDFKDEWHWERFGNWLEFECRHGYNFRSERCPYNCREYALSGDIWNQPKGAALVIEKSSQFGDEDAKVATVAERLKWLRDNQVLVESWENDEWHYYGITVTAEVEAVVNGTVFTTELETMNIGGLEDNLEWVLYPSGSDADREARAKYNNGEKDAIYECLLDLKAQAEKSGFEWPEDVKVIRKERY
jgi:hypothetical protein